MSADGWRSLSATRDQTTKAGFGQAIPTNRSATLGAVVHRNCNERCRAPSSGLLDTDRSRSAVRDCFEDVQSGDRAMPCP